MLIHKKIIEVMTKISAVGKKRRNDGQGYMFRGIDDVYNQLHSVMAEVGIYTIPEVLEERSEERTNQRGTVLIYRVLKIKYTFYAEDGSYVLAIAIGEGMDSGDKSANKAMSAAHKYALMQTFCIPTDEAKDSENEDHQIVEVYKALPPQKKLFAHFCHGINPMAKQEDMAQLSNKLLGCPMNQLENKIKELI